MKKHSVYLLFSLSACMLILNIGCKKNEDDAPPAENEEEIITDIILTFTPQGGGADITALAQDPDGEGIQDLEVTKDLELAPNTTYTLNISLENSLDMESITDEVRNEGDEHMLFFEFTENAFSDPIGNGNLDNRTDPLNYEDMDKNGEPIGLITTWTTGDAVSGANFRVVLKHQPALKTGNSGSSEGSTDLDLTWGLKLQ